MQNTASSQQTPVEKVYLILRVYGLNEENIGLHVYADPKELKFQEESYSVTPAIDSLS